VTVQQVLLFGTAGGILAPELDSVQIWAASVHERQRND